MRTEHLVVLVSVIIPLAACSSSSTGNAPASGDGGSSNSTDGGSSNSTDGGSTNGGDGGSSTTGDGGNNGSDSASNTSPLTCGSYTWCGSGTVTQWNGQTLPTTRGGAIPDGLYREAYRLAEKDTGTVFGDYGSAYLFRSGSVRELGDLGTVGTFTTSQTTLTISWSSNCDDQSGQATSTSTASSSVDYFVDANGALYLFEQSTGSSGAQTIALVYLPETTLCGNLPSAVPASPGDSFVCTVTNCGCTEASNGPADASVCKFVSGG